MGECPLRGILHPGMAGNPGAGGIIYREGG